MAQGENPRLRLIVDQRKHGNAEGGLQLRLGKELLSTTCAFASFFSSMTTRIPFRSVSSRRSLMPSSRLSRT
jgi:hypothetical protein